MYSCRDTISKTTAKATRNKERPVYNRMKKKLNKKLNPEHLQINDDSPNETKFTVTIVSKDFENKPLLQRHRLVNEALNEELERNGGSVHAL